MATLSSNPSYQALAATAATALGNASPSIVKAILAQWQCELGNVSYPPTRNNPGNIAKGFADGVGIPYTVQFPNPQPGNPIVTYGTPADGARAYATGIRTFSRYAAARLAVSQGNGRAFLIALAAAGWGTGLNCMLGVYGGPGVPSTTPIDATLASSVAPASVLDEWLAQIGRQASDPIRDQDVIPFVKFLQAKQIVPGGDPGNPLVTAVINKMQSLVGQPWSAAGASFLQAAGQQDPFGLTSAVAQLGAALSSGLLHAVILIGILGLIAMGVYFVASSES